MDTKDFDINREENYELYDDIPVWDNHPRPVKGLTPFGYFDEDIEFQRDAPKMAKWIAYKLGYPMMDVELLDVQMYACIEEAVIKYSALVNEYKIRENMFNMIGAPDNQDMTGKLIKDNFQNYVRLAQNYGELANAGSNIDVHKAYIELKAGQQRYDLKYYIDKYLGGKPIEIKRLYHFARPAIARYFDPYSNTAIGVNYLISEFGWDNYSPGVNFVLMPVYDDILRLQAIEFSDQVRRSQYSFTLENNILTIFPIPKEDQRLWFDYIFIEDREQIVNPEDIGDKITDGSNVPLSYLPYKDINQWGREWIQQYALGCAMKMLGEIRSKYSNIPIPDSEISLNGSDLKSEGQQLQDNLIQQLRETLEQLMRPNQLEQKQRETEALNQILQQVPLGLYIY